MTNKKILFVGCSFTENCGFTQENAKKYHWPIIICNHYKLDFDNLAVGGASNDEIFFRSIHALQSYDYFLSIVMWSEIGRKFVYFENNNIDDYTIINKGKPCGFLSDTQEAQDYSRLYYSYFNNQYIALKHWLLQIIVLQNLLCNKKQKFLFIKGFENYLSDFINVDYIQNKFFSLSNNIKKITDFDNRPDYFIADKVNEIKKLIQKIDQSMWLNFHTTSFFDMLQDTADDLMHPGPATNQKLANGIIEYIDKRDLLIF